MLSAPTRSRISRLAPSNVPIVSAPFSASFMLPVPDASMPAVEICSERSAAGMIDLRQADIVVRHEHDLQLVAHRRIVVHHLRHIVDQLDDQLGALVAGSRPSGEELHSWHPVPCRLGAHREIKRDRLEDVQQLPLVFVNALDVHINQRIRIDR